MGHLFPGWIKCRIVTPERRETRTRKILRLFPSMFAQEYFLKGRKKETQADCGGLMLLSRVWSPGCYSGWNLWGKALEGKSFRRGCGHVSWVLGCSLVFGSPEQDSVRPSRGQVLRAWGQTGNFRGYAVLGAPAPLEWRRLGVHPNEDCKIITY